MAACRYGISLRVFNLISLTHSLSSSILNTRRKISYLSAPTYHLLFLVRSFSRISSHNYTIYVYYTGYARKNNTCVSWCAERVAWSAVSEILWYKRRKLTLIWSQRSERWLPSQRNDPLSKNQWFRSLKLKAKCVALCRCGPGCSLPQHE